MKKHQTFLLTPYSPHQGDFLGLPATGKKVTLQGVVLSRLEEGLIVEDCLLRVIVERSS